MKSWCRMKTVPRSHATMDWGRQQNQEAEIPKRPKHFQVLFNFPKVFQKVNPNYVLSPRRPCICAPSVVRHSHQVSETHHILFVAHPRHTAVFSFLPPFLFPPPTPLSSCHPLVVASSHTFKTPKMVSRCHPTLDNFRYSSFVQ